MYLGHMIAVLRQTTLKCDPILSFHFNKRLPIIAVYTVFIYCPLGGNSFPLSAATVPKAHPYTIHTNTMYTLTIHNTKDI